MAEKLSNIFVTGGGGYLGSVLVPLLLEQGYKVKVLDRFFFGVKTLESCRGKPNCTIIQGDTRWYPQRLLRGVDAVIDLAALANDSLGEIDQQLTLDINYRARLRTAKMAKQAGIKKYILASSCSVYGFQGGILNENSVVAPQSTYAKANVLAETDILPLANNNFAVTVLRQGTLYGLSPRMRFDLVINTMVLSNFKNGTILVNGGEQWRPLLHVEDSARAFITVLKSDKRKINGQIFNICATNQSLQVKKIGRVVAKTLKNLRGLVVKPDQDHRSYRVSGEKIKRMLNYEPLKTISSGALEVNWALKKKQITDALETQTFSWYKRLLADDPLILSRKIIRSIIKN